VVNFLLYHLHQRHSLHDRTIDENLGKVGARRQAAPIDRHTMTARRIGHIAATGAYRLAKGVRQLDRYAGAFLQLEVQREIVGKGVGIHPRRFHNV
jgi:hypothetical protein